MKTKEKKRTMVISMVPKVKRKWFNPETGHIVGYEWARRKGLIKDSDGMITMPHHNTKTTKRKRRRLVKRAA